ncbi:MULTISPECIES: ATP synthase subunit I [Clostridia]|uniref:ATP synthase subunit I n=1 Tax=Clostridium sp. CCUG 7971 TaxID=2811414 RepID=UPI001ABA64C7|nr:ATP synthase subunit I [Clostridium sp. CCUG 7971]MBO3444045.1 ATP synthase subunit I [Clostridium sp. CCUG 7971]
MDIKMRNEIKYITKGVIVFDIIIIAILLITSNFTKAMLLGIVFGTIIAVLNFRLLALSIDKAVTMSASKAQIHMSSRYVVRMTIIGIVLLVSAQAPYLNILGVALGLLSPKFVILSRRILIDKLKRKEE